MKKLNILFVCGYGVGSSQMMEIVVQKALKNAGIEATLKHTSVGEMSSMLDWADIIGISKKLLEGIDTSNLAGKKVIEIVNVMDGKGIVEKIKTILSEEQ